MALVAAISRFYYGQELSIYDKGVVLYKTRNNKETVLRYEDISEIAFYKSLVEIHTTSGVMHKASFDNYADSRHICMDTLRALDIGFSSH